MLGSFLNSVGSRQPGRILAAATVAALGLATTAFGTTVNVDIQGQRNDGGPNGTDAAGLPTLYSGTGPVGGAFIPLNANSQTTNGSAADLADGHQNGNADNLTVSDLNLGGSGIGFTITGVGADNNYSSADPTNFNAIIFDYVFNNDGSNNNVATPAFTISGLQPGSNADLYFYLQAGGITIPGSTPTSGPGPAPFNTGNTLFFHNVLVPLNGDITGVLTGAPGILGGFTVVGTVPEPASLGLLGLSGLILARRSRR